MCSGYSSSPERHRCTLQQSERAREQERERDGRERERVGRERQKGGINKGLLKPRSGSFRLLIKPDKSGVLKRKKNKKTQTFSCNTQPTKGFLSQDALQEELGIKVAEDVWPFRLNDSRLRYSSIDLAYFFQDLRSEALKAISWPSRCGAIVIPASGDTQTVNCAET